MDTEQIVTKMKEIGIRHSKEIMLECVEAVLPLALKAVAEAIPGQVDDAIIAVAQPIAQEQLKTLIAKIGA